MRSHVYSALQFMPPPPVMCLTYNRGPIELLNGWRIEIVSPDHFDLDRRHGTAWIRDHPQREYRHAICFNFIKHSQTPELNIEKVCKAVALNLNGIIEDQIDRGAHQIQEGQPMPRVHSMNFWDEGLPGELLDLRLQCYVVHYDD